MVGAVGPSRVAMGGVRMSRSRVRVGRWVAILAVISLVGVIGVSAAGAQQNPPVNQPGVTDSEIRVGGVGTVSNDPTGNNPGGPAFEGTQAYFDYINASKDKGVCGRKLVLSSKRDDSLANNRQEIQGLLDDNVFAALPMATSLFTGADLLVSDRIPTFGWLINGEWGSEDRQPGPAQPVRSKRIVPQPQFSGPQLLRRRLAGSEAQQEARRTDRVQRSPVLGICRRRRCDLPEVPEGGEGRAQGHEPLVRRGGLQRPGLQDERREGQPGDPVHRRERRVHPGPRDEEAGPQRADDPAERLQPGAHREERRRRQRQLRVHGLHAVREQVQAPRAEALREVDQEEWGHQERELGLSGG